MDKKLIEEYIEKKSLRKRFPDINRANSLIKTSEITANAVLKIPINEENAILIFREMYEALRGLGDAEFWKMGYEARQHEPSMRILQDANIKDIIDLNKLNRFRKIRNDANYRGYKVTVEQAKDIVEFWNKYGRLLLSWVRK